MTKRERIKISASKEFKEELQSINEQLKRITKERRGNKIFSVPNPGASDEIEFRFYAFQDQQKLLFELLDKFVPMELKEQFFYRIPQSPIYSLLAQHTNEESFTIKAEKQLNLNLPVGHQKYI